jgi:hypothetical protein
MLGRLYRNIVKYLKPVQQAKREDLPRLREEIEKVEKDFSYLLNPGKLPNVY